MKRRREIHWTKHTKQLAAGVFCLLLAATAGHAQAIYTEDGNYVSDHHEVSAEAAQPAPFSMTYDEAQTTVTQGGITYALSSTENTAEVAGYTVEIPAACVIPSSVTDNGQTYAVVGIREGGLYNCSAITSLTVPEGVKTIGSNAVAGCTNLRTVSLPRSIQEIGNSAFEDCSSLQSIHVTEGNSIYDSVDGVLFWNNSSEKTRELLKYPEGWVNRSYTVPNGVSVISNRAFYHADQLQEVTLPDSVHTIGSSAFEHCDQLKAIDLGEGLQTIEWYSFRCCTQLASIELPATLSEFSGSVFLECENLSAITVAEDNPYFFSDGIGLYKKTTEGCVFCVYAPAALQESYAVKDGTTVISDNAFWEAENLKEIQLPEGLQKIKHGVFTSTGLTKLDLPKSVTSVESNAFQSCTDLKELSLGSITEIPKQMLYYCRSLESITIPSTVENIQGHAFVGCDALKEISVEAGNTNYTSENGVLFNKEKTQLLQYPGAKTEEQYTVPQSVTHIAYGTFQTASNLKRIEVESDNTTYYSKDGILFERTGEQISSNIFADGGYGKQLDFGESLHTFPAGKEATSYQVPNGIRTVAPYAFIHNTMLQQLDLDQVCYVGAEAFTRTFVKNFTCENVSHIGSMAFFNSKITHIVLSKKLKELGSQAFDYSTQLSYITFLGTDVPTADYWVAYNCPNLRYVYVPDSEDGSVQAEYARSLVGDLKPGVMIVTGEYVPHEEVAQKIEALSEGSTKEEINQAAISLGRLTPEDISQISNTDLKKVDDLFAKTNEIQVTQEREGSYAKQVEVSGAAVASGLTETIAQGQTVEDTTVTVKVQEETPQFGEIYRLNFTMLVNEEEKELQTPVMVTLPRPESVPENMLYIFHFKDNGEIKIVDYDMVDHRIEFRADSFSNYALINVAKGPSGVSYFVPTGQKAQLVIACYDANGKMTTCSTQEVTGDGSKAVDVPQGQTFKAFLLGSENQPVGTVTIRDWRESDEQGEADR